MRRRHRLSGEGLDARRRAVQRTEPWERSTGPGTPAGTSACRLNAVAHGECSTKMRRMRGESADLLRKVRGASQRTRGVDYGLERRGARAHRLAQVLELISRLSPA